MNRRRKRPRLAHSTSAASSTLGARSASQTDPQRRRNVRHRPLALEFDPEAAANEIVSNFRYIAQADETDRGTRTHEGEIKSNKDGVATHIAAKDDYLVAPLEAVGGGEGAVVPEGATLDRIDDFLILAFDPETTADELVEQFREVAQTEETERTFRTRGGSIKVGEDGVITHIA